MCRLERNSVLRRRFSQKDVEDFARLSGDFNPLHLDEAFAGKTIFNGTIIHGMLAASLFSAFLGMYCPGKYGLILTQELKYLKPVRKNEDLKVTGEVIKKINSIKVLVIKTSICDRKNRVLVEGISRVKIMR